MHKGYTMRRMIVLFLSAALLLSLAMPSAAMPTADLTALARYFPEKTVLFASARVDAPFFASLDSIFSIVHEYMPEAPAVTTEQLLDQIVAESSALTGTFDETVRPWLGDTVAVGIPSGAALFASHFETVGEDPVLFAAEITDRALALAFLEPLMPADSEVNVEENDSRTLITSRDEGRGAIYIDGSVLLITNDVALLPQETITAGLESSEDFANSLSSLPETDYNALLYLNLPEVLAHIPTADLDEMEGAVLSALEPLRDAVGGLVAGATILQGRALTLDIVQPVVNPAAYETLGMTLPTDYTPISFDFARFIPAGTPIVLQSADLQSLYENAIASLRAAAELQAATAPNSEGAPTAQLEQGLAQVEFAVSGLTQLDLQDDILSWMTSDYALAFNFSPEIGGLASVSDPPTELPFDFSFLIDVTDPDAAEALVEGLTQSLVAFGGDSYTVEEEVIGDTTAQHIQFPPSDDLPFPIDIILGASADVFVVGTPRMVEAALNPGDGLAGDPRYLEMQSFALPEPRGVVYLSGEELAPLTRLLVLSRSVNAQDEAAITNLFRLISSSSISSTIGATGTTVTRMVLTLPSGG
jgi:hypothetical protein